MPIPTPPMMPTFSLENPDFHFYLRLTPRIQANLHAANQLLAATATEHLPADTLATLAIAYLEAKEIGKAHQYATLLKKKAPDYRSYQSKHYQAIALWVLSGCSITNGSYREALELLHIAEGMAHYPWLQILCALHKGIAYLSLQHFDKAEKAFTLPAVMLKSAPESLQYLLHHHLGLCYVHQAYYSRNLPTYSKDRIKTLLHRGLHLLQHVEALYERLFALGKWSEAQKHRCESYIAHCFDRQNVKDLDFTDISEAPPQPTVPSPAPPREDVARIYFATAERQALDHKPQKACEHYLIAASKTRDPALKFNSLYRAAHILYNYHQEAPPLRKAEYTHAVSLFRQALAVMNNHPDTLEQYREEIETLLRNAPPSVPPHHASPLAPPTLNRTKNEHDMSVYLRSGI